ncbi:phosphoenolpyruvate synthase [Ktedonosporobacter rubrisoli]|uniref:Phosphoenolpyruvate synthase n=1 Tax=Ktedonosporobacter rubrisoli TaxID=2509675 RepID=A0A4P6K4Z6_KTERU|nr:PEP/pyruvate-binding domain-containing protein [Ktedonosporobacter rubrisoli]QBD83042.1 phosphoenolpyruvate synthase [Ktedonosporobacter rubrisoli]
MSSLRRSTRAQDRGTTPWVLSFEEAGHNELARVGGKGANLGELTRAGLPVPPGFCVTTEAYTQIAEKANLTSLIAALPKEGGQADIAKITATIRKRLLDTSLPSDLAASVRAAYLSLGNGIPCAVAVRSSATAEDLPFASFAGQQDTYLNILGEEALLDAVRRCWASLWTERAVSYRLSNQIDQSSVSLSVVVQRMIDVAVAGVLFTANPLTGKRRQAVIDANPGLGEAVVSGAVNPDHFVVNTSSGEIIERRLGDKRILIRALPDGGTQRIEREDQSKQACLTDEQVRALARLGAQVEEHYQAPQDTEWAIDAAGKLWLTQARPITTLYPLPPSALLPDNVLHVYLSANALQGVYQPFTPMGIALYRHFAASGVRLAGFDPGPRESGPGFLIEANMRLFIDITTALRNPLGRRLLSAILSIGETRSAEILKTLMIDPRLPVATSRRWNFIRRALLATIRLHLPQNLLQALISPQAARQRVRELYPKLQQELTASSQASSVERLDLVENFAVQRLAYIIGSIAPVMASGSLCFALAGKLLGNLADADERQTVLRGLPFNPTTEMDLMLWNIAKKIAAEQDVVTFMLEHSAKQLSAAYQQHTLPPIVQQSLSEFLQTYGHRGVAEIDLGLPRWSDDPTHILGVLLNYLRLKEPDQAPDVLFTHGAQQAEAMVHELTRRATKRNWLRGWLVNFCLRRTRNLVGMRESHKFYVVKIIARMRDILHPVALELVNNGCLEQTDDLYFLSFQEARAALKGKDMRDLVRERRATYEQELHRRHVPHILLSDGSEPSTMVATKNGDKILHGTPASAGRITAKARVIRDPVGAHLEPGEILIAPSTDPGWTPLFLTAGALIMEMGGSMSHGAVVAREYGIPAVVGVIGATERIQTGQIISVDGSTGSIILQEQETEMAAAMS